MNKRLMPLFLFLCAFLLAACGNSATNVSPSAAPTVSSATNIPASNNNDLAATGSSVAEAKTMLQITGDITDTMKVIMWGIDLLQPYNDKANYYTIYFGAKGEYYLKITFPENTKPGIHLVGTLAPGSIQALFTDASGIDYFSETGSLKLDSVGKVFSGSFEIMFKRPDKSVKVSGTFKDIPYIE